jgi:hypothetical protein
MASERDAVLSSVVVSEDGPRENIDAALSEGERTKQLALSHEHAIKMRKTDLGWFGIVFGGEAHAAIVIAFVVIILGFTSAIGLWVVAYYTGKPEFWSSEAHISLAAATSALGFVFGRGSKDSTK